MPGKLESSCESSAPMPARESTPAFVQHPSCGLALESLAAPVRVARVCARTRLSLHNKERCHPKARSCAPDARSMRAKARLGAPTRTKRVASRASQELSWHRKINFAAQVDE